MDAHPFETCTEPHVFERSEHCGVIDPETGRPCDEPRDAEVHAVAVAA